MAHSTSPEAEAQILYNGEPGRTSPSDTGNTRDRLHSQSSPSDEQCSHKPAAIEITPELNVIDLTGSPTDSYLQEELQGITIQDLDDDDEHEVSAIQQANSKSNIPSPKPSSIPVEFHIPTETPSPTTVPISVPPKRSIRFRSRVRITSGVHRKRRSQKPNIPVSDLDSLHPNPLLAHSEVDTTVSSCSSSPSSSISAPIRFREDEATVSPRWGPLGQRVQLFVSKQREKSKQIQADREAHEREIRRRYLLVYGTDVDPEVHGHERTPLLDPRSGGRLPKTPTVTSFDDDDGSDMGEVETESEYQARLDREIDILFGKWPGRLLNCHWWWWHLRPVICCSYAEDWEAEC
ncbi:hypothetical protein C8R42DRAFT_664474 [Lentinula raphanica]|nr:hypothetical protein C8R42DRAFT_664474 [Lentinula raphanica]